MLLLYCCIVVVDVVEGVVAVVIYVVAVVIDAGVNHVVVDGVAVDAVDRVVVVVWYCWC